MKSVTVVSGKGGTGKTTLVGSLAALAESKVLADCDVDAADLHLLLHPTVRHREFFQGGRLAVIEPEECSRCGVCEEVCRFDAVDSENRTISPLECEGCGVCVIACPNQAIELRPRNTGQWFLSESRYGPLVHASLGIGQGNSGLLVTVVRREAERVAAETDADLVLIDGPPGIGCPVISAVTGSDLVVAVTEPTLAGMHDLARVLGLAGHFGVPSMVVINKHDLNLENTRDIEAHCAVEEIPVIGKIPYDEDTIQALTQGEPIVCHRPASRVAEAVRTVWQRISIHLSKS